MFVRQFLRRKKKRKRKGSKKGKSKKEEGDLNFVREYQREIVLKL